MKKNKLFLIQKTIQKEIGIIYEIDVDFDFELEKKGEIAKHLKRNQAINLKIHIIR